MFFCQWTRNTCFQWKLSTRPSKSLLSLFSSKSNLRLIFVPRQPNELSTHQSRFSSNRFLQTHFNGETGNDGFNERRPLLRRESSSSRSLSSPTSSSSTRLTSDPRLFSLKVPREKILAIWNLGEAKSSSFSSLCFYCGRSSDPGVDRFGAHHSFSSGQLNWSQVGIRNWLSVFLPGLVFLRHRKLTTGVFLFWESLINCFKFMLAALFSLFLFFLMVSLFMAREEEQEEIKKTAPTEKGRLGRPLGDERERFQLSIKGALPWELFIVDMCVV